MHTSRNYISAAALLSASLLYAPSACAVDGVIEINQTCAVTGGCFAGDTAGFPVTITNSAPGHSFRLTSDLLLANTTNDAISVTLHNSHIDLNGFSIITQACNNFASTLCRPGASVTTAGVNADGIGGVSVSNGSIVGMGRGVKLGSAAHVSYITARLCFVGVNVGQSSTVSNSIAASNGSSGINAGAHSTVNDNTVSHSNGLGIHATDGSTIKGNTVFNSQISGIFGDTASTIIGNTSFGNGGHGISAYGGATISGNTSFDNEGSGISSGPGSSVNGNTLRNNTGYGLDPFPISTATAYRNNTITDNTAGTVDTGGYNMGGNFCNSNATCP